MKPLNIYLRPWTSQVNIYQSKYGISTDLKTVAHSTCSKTGSSHSKDKTPDTSNWQNGFRGFAKKGLLISDYRRNPSIFFLYHYLFLKVEIHTFDPQAHIYSRSWSFSLRHPHDTGSYYLKHVLSDISNFLSSQTWQGMSMGTSCLLCVSSHHDRPQEPELGRTEKLQRSGGFIFLCWTLYKLLLLLSRFSRVWLCATP